MNGTIRAVQYSARLIAALALSLLAHFIRYSNFVLSFPTAAFSRRDDLLPKTKELAGGQRSYWAYVIAVSRDATDRCMEGATRAVQCSARLIAAFAVSLLADFLRYSSFVLSLSTQVAEFEEAAFLRRVQLLSEKQELAGGQRNDRVLV
mmetsp:Transcript_67824/g.141427  ORF Transcript_67824/g.141427 Transcript_67824/m.141427 type:complete len:149 (-) Transcript_67824:269-715(-)